jgi:hypothetical protein
MAKRKRTSNPGVERFRSLLAAVLLLGFANASPAQTDAPAQADPGATGSGFRRALIVCGLPGDEEHRKLFAETVELLYSGLVDHHGFAAGEVRVLWGDEASESDGPAVRSSRGPTTRETITAAAQELRDALTPDDALWVFVLGHAHYDGRYVWLNISGPDIQQLEFGKLFEGLPAREQVFFITTSCSGFYLKPLARPGRIVIAATEPDLEVNETLFPHKLAIALGSPPPYEELEFDKDGRLTLLDVYLWTTRQVAQEYVTGELLATEHAQLDDNGDGRGAEIQIDYLPEELGGRLKAGQEPARPKADGEKAIEIVLSWPVAGADSPAPAEADPNAPPASNAPDTPQESSPPAPLEDD